MRAVITLGLAMGLVGCTSGNDPVPPIPGSAGELVDGYPAGPFGSDAGSVVRPFCWDGYRDPSSSREPERVCLQDAYNPEDTAELPSLLLVAVGALWCMPCAEEAEEHTEIYPEFSDLGLEIFTVITESDVDVPAELGDLDIWVSNFESAHPSVIDPSYQISALFADQYPSNILVDTRTMRIIEVSAGKPMASYYDGLRARLTAD